MSKGQSQTKTTQTKNPKELNSIAESLFKDLKRIKWASWGGKDGVWHRFLKVLTFSVALLAFFAIGNFIISLVWGLF